MDQLDSDMQNNLQNSLDTLDNLDIDNFWVCIFGTHCVYLEDI